MDITQTNGSKPDLPSDPLSDIIDMLRPHDCVAAGLDAGGDWAIRFERHAGMKCNAVVRGACELTVDGTGEAFHLHASDCFILPHGRPFLISSHGAALGDDAEAIYRPVPHGRTAIYGGGGDFFMTGARFLVSGPAARALLAILPPVIVIRRGSRSEAVRQTLDGIARELREPSPGSALAVAHLSHLLLVEVLRQHLAQQLATSPDGTDDQAIGWMAALADPAISRALAAMHSAPARAWTVGELASHAAMSRTSFAVRFKRVVGQAPMAYLTEWRMLRAADRLVRTSDPVARIAEEVGYASESAFAHAFKRETGRSPRRYAREGSGGDGMVVP